ncbi:Hypothetical protein, putative, partial [Bodo saltans]
PTAASAASEEPKMRRRQESPAPDAPQEGWTIPKLSHSVTVSSTAVSSTARGDGSLALSQQRSDDDDRLSSTMAPPPLPQGTLDAAALVGYHFPTTAAAAAYSANAHPPYSSSMTRANHTNGFDGPRQQQYSPRLTTLAAPPHFMARNTSSGSASPHTIRAISPDDVRDAMRALKREELGDSESVLFFDDTSTRQDNHHHHHHHRAAAAHQPFASSSPHRGNATGAAEMEYRPLPFRSQRTIHPPAHDDTSVLLGDHHDEERRVAMWQRQRMMDDAVVCCPCCFHVFTVAEHRVHNASSP